MHACPVTNEPRALRLLASRKASDQSGPCYVLTLEGLEALPANGSSDSGGKRWTAGLEKEEGKGKKKHGKCGGETAGDARFGLAEVALSIRQFDGVEKIYDQVTFPLAYHLEGDGLRTLLLERARRWADLCGMRHASYGGMAAMHKLDVSGNCWRTHRYSVKSRIMVDIGDSHLVNLVMPC